MAKKAITIKELEIEAKQINKNYFIRQNSFYNGPYLRGRERKVGLFEKKKILGLGERDKAIFHTQTRWEMYAYLEGRQAK